MTFMPVSPCWGFLGTAVAVSGGFRCQVLLSVALALLLPAVVCADLLWEYSCFVPVMSLCRL